MTACPCITAVSLHTGHCCLADLPGNATLPLCHPAEWEAVCDAIALTAGESITYNRVTRERVWFTASGAVRWISRHFGPWETLTPPELIQEALL